ncbi:MAG: hypothetical protein HY064_01165 [Bacteroidetes bacterium]|nr:hypothetical protein [Bacteroidota bacterium]
MKKVYAGITGILFAFAAFAQTSGGTTTASKGTATTTTTTTSTGAGSAAPSNCYTKWEQKFEERGAEDVKDGVYDDVIISVRSGPDAQCYTGRVEVKEGKIISMERKLQDGTYETYKPKLKYDVPMTITNGVSATLLTKEDDLINVIFPKSLKPKKVGYSTAPEPPED